VESAKVIWMDGKMVPWDDARIHILSHSLHYGSGVFEGIRCYDTPQGPAVFRLKDHVRRLYESAHIMMMKIPFTAEELSGAVRETIRANGMRECYIRPLVHRGYGTLGVNPLNCPVVVSIAVWKWGAYLGEEGLTHGIRAKVSSFCRSHVNTLATKAKATGNYLNAIMAKMEALKDGYDEAILLDTDGNLSEGSGENLFIVDRGRVKTVAERTILLGVTRETVMTLLADAGRPVQESMLTRDQLYAADEAFFTGTAAEITPIREVDHRSIGRVSPGPITREIQEQFFAVVHGKEPRYHHWCDWV
jgi:branched-chain amino acid aminotransferase